MYIMVSHSTCLIHIWSISGTCIHDLSGGKPIVTERLKIGSIGELNVTFAVKDDGYYFIVFVLNVAQEA